MLGDPSLKPDAAEIATRAGVKQVGGHATSNAVSADLCDTMTIGIDRPATGRPTFDVQTLSPNDLANTWSEPTLVDTSPLPAESCARKTGDLFATSQMHQHLAQAHAEVQEVRIDISRGHRQ